MLRMQKKIKVLWQIYCKHMSKFNSSSDHTVNTESKPCPVANMWWTSHSVTYSHNEFIPFQKYSGELSANNFEPIRWMFIAWWTYSERLLRIGWFAECSQHIHCMFATGSLVGKGISYYLNIFMLLWSEVGVMTRVIL